jgi:hypothetical protein
MSCCWNEDKHDWYELVSINPTDSMCSCCFKEV